MHSMNIHKSDLSVIFVALRINTECVSKNLRHGAGTEMCIVFSACFQRIPLLKISVVPCKDVLPASPLYCWHWGVLGFWADRDIPVYPFSRVRVKRSIRSPKTPWDGMIWMTVPEWVGFRWHLKMRWHFRWSSVTGHGSEWRAMRRVRGRATKKPGRSAPSRVQFGYWWLYDKINYVKVYR